MAWSTHQRSAAHQQDTVSRTRLRKAKSALSWEAFSRSRLDAIHSFMVHLLDAGRQAWHERRAVERVAVVVQLNVISISKTRKAKRLGNDNDDSSLWDKQVEPCGTPKQIHIKIQQVLQTSDNVENKKNHLSNCHDLHAFITWKATEV